MRLTTDKVHYTWDNTIRPAATIEPGELVELDLVESSGGQLSPDSSRADVARLDFTRVNPVTGPLYIAGARPGDALVVTIRELTVGDWGWTATIPGFGLLADDFETPNFWSSRVDQPGPGGVHLPFGPVLPLRPMIGTIGVALPEPGSHSLVPPSRWGGNMDIRHVTAGSSLVLPVGVEGALLSVGDAHAAMGDGEVCGTGIETPAHAVLDVAVLAGAAPRAPIIETVAASHRTGRALATAGIGPDWLAAARDATRLMIDEVVRRTGLAAVEAYALCSVTGDLVASQVVDAPNWTVTMHVPADVLS